MRRITRFSFRIVKNFSSLLMRQVTIFIITVLTFSIITRLLSTVEMGVYGLLVSLLYLVGLTANFGLKKVGIRYIAGKKALGLDEEAKGTFWRITLISLPFIIIVSLGIYLLLDYLKIFRLIGDEYALSLYLILLILFSFRNTIQMGLQAQHLFHYETLYYSIGYILYRFLMVNLLLLGLGVRGIIIAWIIGEILTIGLTLTKIFNIYKPFIIEGDDTKNLIKSAFPVYVTDIILTSMEYGDRIASALLGINVVAYFYIATTGVMFLSALYQSVQESILPSLSEDYHLNGLDGINYSIKRISRYVFIFISPIFVIVAGLAEPLIFILAGSLYISSAPILQIMCIGLWLGSFNYLLQSAFIAANRNEILMVIILISIIIDLFIMIKLYPIIGALSTGLGRTMLIIISTLLMLIIAIKTMGISIDFEAYFKTLFSSGIAGYITWLTWMLMRRVDLFPLYLIIGGGLYFLILRLLKFLRPEEVASLYISLKAQKQLKLIIKIICILSGVEYSEVMRLVERK